MSDATRSDAAAADAAGDAPGSGTGPSPDDATSATSPMTTILAGLAVGGLDVEGARHLASLRATRRLRHRHVMIGGAAVVIALVAAVVLWPRPGPRKVIAADATTTSTSSTSTTSTVAESTTAPTTIAPVTTVPGSTITTVATTAAPTTTLPPPRPMALDVQVFQVSEADGTLVGPVTRVAVGSYVVARVNWADPDLGDPSLVRVGVDFGDQLVTIPVPAGSAQPPCDAPGGGATGRVDSPFRYSVAATATITVEATTCDATGRYGKRITRTLALTVDPPPAGRRVAVLAGVADSRSGDAGEVVAGPGAPTPPRVPALRQVLRTDGSPVTLASMASTYSGTVMLRWATPPVACQSSKDPVQSTVDGATALLTLGPVVTTSCGGSQATTSSTTP